ncbi:uncharacterized protein LOC734363 isoform X2 [Xenopus laevis]|nr:C-reactive protein-like [Xenopus laevis]XP_041428077.1 uncharacterized protein LOC734363 isoform X2 [Xenopus laevis]AAH91727.1 MGC97884 protein [Xenopus laevis]OCT69026.1 hypothetical protein XELAEV_18040334mg [Xenopus laevis]
MARSVFLFPRSSADDYVVLKPMVTEPLNKLTVCFRSYTEGGRYAFFNTGTPESQIYNPFVIFQQGSSYLNIYMNNTYVSIPDKADVLEWIHRCVTWDSDTGVLQLRVNGKVYPRRVVNKGFSIDLQEGISLGQMQMYYGTEWDPNTSFQGEICDFHMWNRVLSLDDMREADHSGIDGNVISWNRLNYIINGEVIVQPKPMCTYSSRLGYC